MFKAELVDLDQRVTFLASLFVSLHSSNMSSEFCFSHETTFGLATSRHVHPEQDHARIATGSVHLVIPIHAEKAKNPGC